MGTVARNLHGRLGAALDDLTEHWVGWTFPPAVRAIADAPWSPDDAAAYCGRCGDSVGPGEATADGCATCREGAELEGGIADGVVRLGSYVEPLRGWVQAIKYERWQEMADELGTLLAHALRDSRRVDLARTAIVPAPMPWQRRLYRGIDHTAAIAHAMATHVRAPVARMLARANHPPQVGLTPSERRRAGSRGMRTAWRWGGWPVEEMDLVLVDDVRTTGATLKAAASMLKRLRPRKVVCAVIAVSDAKARQSRNRLRADQLYGDS